MIHIVKMTPEFLVGWLTKGNKIKARVKDGLPERCILIGAHYDQIRKYVEFRFVDGDEGEQDIMVQLETMKDEEDYVPFLTK